MIYTDYKLLIKSAGFNPSPVAGKIPIWADSQINPRVADTQQFRDFWDEQFDRCVNGYDTAGVHISGRYYFFLNFQILQGLRGSMYPMYVDLDREYWDLFDQVKKNQRKGIISVKARRKGLSENAQTVLNHGIRFIQGYRGAICAGLDAYQVGLRQKFNAAQSNIRPELRLNVLKDNDKMYNIGYERKDPIGGYVDDGYGGRLTFETLFDDAKKLEGEYFHDVIYEESGQFKLLDEAFESIDPALQFGMMSLGTHIIYGCVCAGTKIWNNKGELINIEDLVPENGILGFDGIGISKENITYWQPPKEKPCYRITTHTGRILECSNDHPILWSRKGYYRGPHSDKKKSTKFVTAEKIKIGDQVATIESVPIFGKTKGWEPRFIGWLIGDGSYGFDKTPVMSSCDDEINLYILRNFNAKIEKTYFTKDLKIYQETRIKDICHKLREIGIYGQTKSNKRLPINVQSWIEKDICDLLGGIFDTDGHINEFGECETITLTQSSYDLLFEIQLLLQKLGIHCNITLIKCNPGNGRKDRNDYYRMNISSLKDVCLFKNKISFSIKYKQEKLDRICNKMLKKSQRNAMGVNGLRFERVVSVEYIGYKPVYNLTAGKTNTYIANGIVTHNTGGNILSTSKAFKNMWDNAEAYGLERFWVSGARKYYPFWGNEYDDSFVDKDTGSQIEALPNLKKFTAKQVFGCEDIKAAEEYILKKRVEYSKLPNKKKLKDLNQNYPLTVEEAFTSGGSNNFNDEKIYAKLFEIEGSMLPYQGYILEFVQEIGDDGIRKIKYPLEVNARPAKKNDIDGEIVWIYQMPRTDMTDLDVGGVDGYNQDQTQTNKSLGAMVVMRQGNKVNLISEGIHPSKYPVCLYYKRPIRKEIFYDTCLKISVFYNLLKNTMCNAEQDFVIDYYTKNDGKRYLSPRPRAFDSPKSQQMHKYGAKMTGYSKPLILGVVQSYVEDDIDYCNFVELLRDLLAYDEEYVGTDWDSVDALAYAIMRIEDMKTRPRKSDDEESKDDIPRWGFDSDGNAILMNQQSLIREENKEKKRGRLEEGGGGFYQPPY